MQKARQKAEEDARKQQQQKPGEKFTLAGSVISHQIHI